MRGRLGFFIFFILIMAVYGQQTNIAVLDLDPTGISLTEAQFLSDRLRTELFETGTFQVVERQKMNSILNEQGFQNTGCTSIECAVEIGQLLNVQKMVAGSIGKIEDIYSISLRLIDVRSGAILKTATSDFRGKLSSVLTEVIPSVAKDLASSSDTVVETESGKPAQPIKNIPGETVYPGSGFALFIKSGFTSLAYATDLSSVQGELKNLAGYREDEISQHYQAGFELQYGLYEQWSVKLGIIQLNSLSGFIPSLDGYNPDNSTQVNVHGDFERYYIFVNTYVGVNYEIWRPGERSAVYIGMDIGGLNLRSGLNEVYKLNDGTTQAYDKEYTYSVLAYKINSGYSYLLSSKFILAAELIFQFTSSFDISDQERKDLFPQELDRLLYPEELATSGIQLNLMFGYHF